MSHPFMKYLKISLAVLALFAASASQAVIISNATPIPDANVLLNYNNSGLDWVYAGPIAPNEFGPGNIQPATYRAAEGWRVATFSEWAAHPIWSDFIIPGQSVGAVGHFTDHSKYLFASEYWSDFRHVDINDFKSGLVTDGVNGRLSGVPETIYVRVSAVPEPETYAMLLAGLGVMGTFARRRKQKSMAA